jgi:hypothetical protein
MSDILFLIMIGIVIIGVSVYTIITEIKCNKKDNI